VCTAYSAGDHALTGLAIGKMLGIAGNNTVISGPEIDTMTEEQLRGVSATRFSGTCSVGC
jgi:magnesium-transporting ATPase (P-type)